MNHLVRVCVFGAGSVGKTAITTKFTSDIFITQYDPTIEDSYRRMVEVEGYHCMLEIVDTAGAEQFSVMREMYIKSGQGFLLVFSITSESSFLEIPPIYEQILNAKSEETDEETPPRGSISTPKVPIVLVGNKHDLEDQRRVSLEATTKLAKEWNASYMETSAKTGFNIEKIFQDLTRLILIKQKVLTPTGQVAKPAKQRKKFCVIL